MKCLRCGSQRAFRFIDGTGHRRIFCRDCGASYLEESLLEFGIQKNLFFEKKILSKFVYTNPRALVRFR